MTLVKRVEMVGIGLYGAQYRRALAAGLGISRVTLWHVLSGARSARSRISIAQCSI